MTDTQPLLLSADQFSYDDGSKQEQSSVKPSRHWLRYLGIAKLINVYEKLEVVDDQNEQVKPVGFFEMFRFADKIDRWLLLAVLISSMGYAFCMIINYTLLGRLTGIFAMKQTSIAPCNHINGSSTPTNGCLLGIERNEDNYQKLNKFCNQDDELSLLRFAVIHKIYWLLVAASIEMICEYVQYLTINITSRRQTSRMRALLFRSLLQRNVAFYDKNSPSQTSAKLFENLANMNKGIGYEFALLIAAAFYTLCSVSLSFTINWRLTLIVLGIIPILVIGSYSFSYFIAKESMDEMKSYSKAGRIVQEVFSSLRTVLSFNGQNFERKRYANELDATQQSTVRKGLFLGLFVGWTFCIVYVTYSVGFLCAFFLFEEQNLSDTLVVLTLLTQGVIFIGYIGPSIQAVAEARGAAVDVFRLIDEANNEDENEAGIWKTTGGEKQLIDINGDIEFHNVSFAYSSREEQSILNNVNLVARAGETTAFVGPSGCGKSTCLSLLLRYYTPSSGEITINGRSITEYSVRNLRHSIGVVNQEPVLFDTTIYENIRLGQENATQDQIEEAARQANAHDFIMKLPNKYMTLVGERGAQLSGGEKQRIALARALVKQPTLLLLDEATSALDSNNQKIVQEALDRSSKNRTTIVIAHRLATIQNADQIYVFDNGKVIEQGTHDALMAKEGGTYKQMVELQQMVKLDEETTSSSDDEKKPRQDKVARSTSESQRHSIDETVLSAKEKGLSFFRVLSMNSPEWCIILIGCLMSILGGISQVVAAFILPKTINALNRCTYEEQRSQVIILTSFFFGLAALILFIRLFQFGSFALSGSKLTKRIRLKAFSCLLRQEVAYFDQPENSSGAICARLQTDVVSVQKMTGTRLGVICEIAAMCVLALAFGFWFSHQLTLILFFSLIIVMIIAVSDIRFKTKTAERSEQKLEQASSLAVEAILNLKTIKQLGAEEEILRKYTNLVDQSYKIHRNASFISAAAFGLFWGTYGFILAALFYCALVLVESRSLEPQDIIIVFAFATFLLYFLQAITNMSEDMSASLKAARSFFFLFDRIPAIDNDSNEGEKLPDFRGEIEFRNVKFTYPSRLRSNATLHNFQLSIKPGQHVALVGTSGCGKSTIIQLLERFYDVQNGQLLLDGVDIQQLNIQWVRSKLGLVSQEPILFNLTIAENIAYGQEDSTFEDIMGAAKRANIYEFIEQLPEGFQTQVGLKGNRLSGGEKQRIAIARALLRRPKVLMLDEATSALDSHSEQIVQRALEEAQTEDPTRTVIVIAHRLSTIRSCDRICVVQNGHIVESGNHAELMQQRGIYYRMVLQNQ